MRLRGSSASADELPVISSACRAAAVPERTVAPSPVEDWMDALLRTEVYRRKQSCRGATPPAGGPREMPRALDSSGGSLTRSAFARAVEVDLVRLDGFLSKLQRILNVDGYEILRHDRERNLVVLQKELLLKQFEVD